MIGTSAAIIGSALIAGGATVAASKKNSSAVNKATAAQQDSTAQQIAAQERARAENTAALSPWMQRGNAAGEMINAALGIGGAPGVSALYNGGYPDAGQYPGTVAANAPSTPQQAAASAYEAFKQSTGYQTRLTEGNRSLASNYFGGGVGQSGAAMKAALRFGQDYGSREFGNWMGMLGNQQGVGFSGASALAGVSQGFADRMGDISQNNANFMGQAAVARAQNSGALMSGLAGIAGNAIGALSSYGQPRAPSPMSGGGYVINNYGYA
jgi:hypothetical protein